MARSARPGREAFGAQARDGDRLTIRAVVEYDGSNVAGFQFQPGQRTIGGILKSACEHVLREPIAITGAGRTDAGVHASGQVVSFTTTRAFPYERLAIALNANLPTDVCVRDAAIVDPAFSARFSARERTYVYAILARPQRAALYATRAYHVYRDVDLNAMRDASAALLGQHDFRSFCASLPDNGNTVRSLRELSIERRGPFLRIVVRADGFLHRMVRTIVGTLVDCASARIDPRTVRQILDARDRRAAGHTAPAHGLYLAGVRYEDGFDSFSEPAIFP